MKYPITPEFLDALPEELAELFRSLELKLIDRICSRLVIADNLNEVTIESIRRLRAQGIPLEEIERAIRETTGVSKRRLDELFDEVIERNQKFYAEVMTLAKITQPQTLVSDWDMAIIRAQTQDELTNITRSMGFLLRQGGRMVKADPAGAYQWALDKASTQIGYGSISYNEAIADAVRELAESGLRVVTYDSGHVDHLDVAVRRAVMTGVAQLSDKYTEAAARELNTDYYEVSAHSGARDTGVGWQNHKSWQGRVYSVRAGDKYPSIYEKCGLGEVDGLQGANCRHRRYPFIDGVMERTYTDAQLENIDPPPFEFEGREYTAYEATQKQREIERNIRKHTRLQSAYKASGQAEKATAAGARLRRLRNKYREFSETARLPLQWERARVLYDA